VLQDSGIIRAKGHMTPEQKPEINPSSPAVVKENPVYQAIAGALTTGQIFISTDIGDILVANGYKRSSLNNFRSDIASGRFSAQTGHDVCVKKHKGNNIYYFRSGDEEVPDLSAAEERINQQLSAGAMRQRGQRSFVQSVPSSPKPPQPRTYNWSTPEHVKKRLEKERATEPLATEGEILSADPKPEKVEETDESRRLAVRRSYLKRLGYSDVFIDARFRRLEAEARKAAAEQAKKRS